MGDIGVAIDAVRHETGVDSVRHHVGHSVRSRDEVLDQAADGAMNVRRFAVTAASVHRDAVGRGEFVRECRFRVRVDEHVSERHGHGGIVRRYRVIGDVQPGREVEALTGGTLVDAEDVGRVADGAVAADLHFLISPGVLAERHVHDVIAVAGDVVAGRKARHDPVRLHADDVPGGFGEHVLVSRAEVGRPAIVDSPVVLHVYRRIVDVQRRADHRRIKINRRLTRDEGRNNPALRVFRGRAGRVSNRSIESSAFPLREQRQGRG